MINVNLFGVGAAGNKAAVEVLEKGYLDEERVKLVNTTTKDIPDKYKQGKNLVVQFGSSSLDGCGKEPNKGSKAMTEAILENKINLEEMITEDCEEIILVSSTEGGTGCGATPVLAKFFETMNIPVHVFALIGFQDDSRGLNNTLKFFKNLSDNVILHTIMNDQFLDYTGNFEKAERAANAEFAEQVRVIIGSKMIPCSQNMDNTDMYKVTATSGYEDIKHVSLTGVKNLDTFNDAIIKEFDNGHCLEYERGCKRLAIIVNASDRVREAIDSRLEVIKRYTGEPIDTFRHIQCDPNDSDEYMDIIVSGMNFPEKGIVDISKKYAELKQNINKSTKSMDDIFSEIDMDDEEDFDIRQRNDNAAAMFAKLVGAKSKQQKINNVVQKSNPGDEEY